VPEVAATLDGVMYGSTGQHAERLGRGGTGVVEA
jgi:hypothetical protein